MDIEAFLKFVRASNVPKVRMTSKAITYILDGLSHWKKGLSFKGWSTKEEKNGMFQYKDCIGELFKLCGLVV